MTLPYEDGDGFEDLVPVQSSDAYGAIPDEMKLAHRWLVYRMEPIPGSDKKNKIPYDPKTGRRANNSELGVSYEEARAVEKNYSGLGFYVEDPFVVIDIDGCVDKEGLVADYAADIIREMNTYSEASPSGTGIHVWARGQKPGDACRRGIEIYSTKRFLTVTGIQVPGTPREVRPVDIEPIYNRMLAGDFTTPEVKTGADIPAVEPTKISTEVQSAGKVITSKEELLMRGEILVLKPFTVGDAHGNTVVYPSQSEADLALATLLAFKYKGDAEKIDADFRISTLYRQKWDRVDYRDGTIKSAIAFYRKTEELKAPIDAVSSQMVEPEDEDDIVDLDIKLPDFPELTGSLRDLSDALSSSIPVEFKMCSAITHMGLLRSGLDTLYKEQHIQPRFYTILIAEPGRGKSAAMNDVTKYMEGLAKQYKVVPSFDSGPAMVDAFLDEVKNAMMRADGTDNLTDARMGKILLFSDEIRGAFEKAKITAGSRNSLLEEFLKLYEANRTGNRARGSKSKIDIDCAHLGILGGATPSGYVSMWTGTGGSSGGLQSRIIPVGIEGRPMPAFQEPIDNDKLAAALLRLTEQAKQPACKYQIDADAEKMYVDWWTSKNRDTAAEVRVDGVVKRLLIILARTNDVETVNIDLVRQAIEFGDFVIACRDKYNPLDASTWQQAFENLIISVYQRFGDMSANRCRRIVHPERRPGGAGPFLQAFKNLVASGILRDCGKTQRSTKYRLSL